MDLLAIVNRLTQPSFGLPTPFVHRLFTAVVVPKVEYALPIWYTPIHTPSGSNWWSGSIQHTKEIEKVQRTACRLIMGAFCSMATDVLELHANIPPVHLRLTNTCFRETLKLCTLPASHLLSSPVKHAAKHLPQCHPSPLHMLLHLFN